MMYKIINFENIKLNLNLKVNGFQTLDLDFNKVFWKKSTIN